MSSLKKLDDFFEVEDNSWHKHNCESSLSKEQFQNTRPRMCERVKYGNTVENCRGYVCTSKIAAFFTFGREFYLLMDLKCGRLRKPRQNVFVRSKSTNK